MKSDVARDDARASDAAHAGGCPVCGYEDVVLFDANQVPTYDICSSCGFESGVDGIGRPDGENFIYMRRLWLSKGAGWWSPVAGPPPGWDAATQLARLTLPEASEAGTAWLLDLAADDDAMRLATSGAEDARRLWAERLLDQERTQPDGWQADARRCFGPDRWPPDLHLRAFMEAAIRSAAEICEVEPNLPR